MMKDLTITFPYPEDNEGTRCPVWLVINPSQMLKPSPAAIALMIDGPFFSREEATEYLDAHRYRYSEKAVVYCTTGVRSPRYKAAFVGTPSE